MSRHPSSIRRPELRLVGRTGPRIGLFIVVALGLACGMASSVSASVLSKNTKSEQTLINKHAPPSLRSTCVGNTARFKKNPPSNLKPYVKNLLASVNCPLNGQGAPDAVTYQQFANIKSMNELYSFNLAESSIQIGENASAGTCPKEEGYSVGSSKALAGDYGCAPSTSSAPSVLFWTSNRLRILSVAAAKTDPDGSLVLNVFHTGGLGPAG